MEKIKLVFGTMTFGPQVDHHSGRAMIRHFIQSGYREIDTAYVYNEGKTEKILGLILNDLNFKQIKVATKVNPRITGRLDEAAVTGQLNESLLRLNLESVDTLYLHMPDPNTPIEETLVACDKLYKEGKYKKLGLSNFPAWMVADIWHICNNNGWAAPSVYQGRYNAISRNIEKELLPALRRMNIPCYVFNPLAGGLLTGKHTDYTAQPPAGRFSLRQSYRDRYWKKELIDIICELVKNCQEDGVLLAEAALRWLAYHSKLNCNHGDAVIIGASSMKQLVHNIDAIKEGPLPSNIVNSFDSAWDEATSFSPDYFRFYNA
jgi:aflatoxin B1 aldehyde reductase